MDQIPKNERPHPLMYGPERAQLESWLAYYRASLIRKCCELPLADLQRRPIPTSSLSLLGLIRHMTLVEQIWFQLRFAGLDVTEYYRRANDRDADFNDLDSASLDEVLANYDTATAASLLACEGHALDERVARITNDRDVDLRWIYIHMIEEYARHLGHADLLRELIDGRTGL